MSLKKKINSGKTTLTGEIAPGKTPSPGKVLGAAGRLKDYVDAINVTDNQRACVKASSLGVSKILMENGMEPVFQMTCRDRNRIGLQSDLLGAHMMGIRNILALTGDHPSAGDHPNAKPVYDIDSTQLIKTLTLLNQGLDMQENEVDGKTDFFIGAAFNPGADDTQAELLRVEKKIDAGAQFFQTQLVYDPEGFRQFISRLKGKASVLVGIAPLKSVGMAKFMDEKVPGVKVPENLISELAESKDPMQKGIEQAAEIIKQLKGCCAGYHIMSLGAEENVGKIIRLAGLA